MQTDMELDKQVQYAQHVKEHSVTYSKHWWKQAQSRQNEREHMHEAGK